MQHIKRIFPKIISIIILTWFLLFPIALTNAATSDQATWQFSSAEDFTISAGSKVAFFDDSVKIIPTDFVKAWSKIWHDTHFNPDPGNSTAWSIVVDSQGYIYVGGDTDNGAVGDYYAFIVKLDQNLNEIWYKRYFITNHSVGGINGMVFASDGNLISAGHYLEAAMLI